MNTEEKIIEWITGKDSLAQDARIIARGETTGPGGKVFRHGAGDLRDWVRDILFRENFGAYAMNHPDISPSYPAVLGVRVTESEVCTADWEEIRKTLLGCSI